MSLEGHVNIGTELPSITQSKFFSPALNAAIFDGPLRIYFAQYQEAEALKIYFHLQEQFKSQAQLVRSTLKDSGSHVFVMLYPTDDIFKRSFEGIEAHKMAFEKVGENFILGLNGAHQCDDYDFLWDELSQKFSLPM